MNDNGIRGYRPGWIPPGVPQSGPARSQPAAKTGSPNASFQELLQRQVRSGETQDQQVKFSDHARSRLVQRGIPVSDEMLGKLNDAVDKAAKKGSKDALIVMRDMAMIVNVKNRTVVTAVDSQTMKDNVFTQIDSAVIVP